MRPCSISKKSLVLCPVSRSSNCATPLFDLWMKVSLSMRAAGYTQGCLYIVNKQRPGRTDGTLWVAQHKSNTWSAFETLMAIQRTGGAGYVLLLLCDYVEVGGWLSVCVLRKHALSAVGSSGREVKHFPWGEPLLTNDTTGWVSECVWWVRAFHHRRRRPPSPSFLSVSVSSSSVSQLEEYKLVSSWCRARMNLLPCPGCG